MRGGLIGEAHPAYRRREMRPLVDPPISGQKRFRPSRQWHPGSRQDAGDNRRYDFQDLLKADRPHVVVRDKLSALKVRMAATGLHTMVASAANLMNDPIFPASCAAALKLFEEVRIVSYIRRQDDFLISS
jgi:hypothetical protein